MLKSSHSGFSLLEVMISFLVVAIALIALLTAQLRSLQFVNDSFNYTVSLVQANNVIERMLPRLCELQHTNPGLYNEVGFQQSLQPQSDYYTLTLPANDLPILCLKRAATTKCLLHQKETTVRERLWRTKLHQSSNFSVMQEYFSLMKLFP